MTIPSIGLAAGFVFVVVLLLVLTLRTPYHWCIKLGVIALSLALYLVTFYALPGFFGWPTRQALPQKFFLIDAQIDEPRNDADAGAIYLWVDSLLDEEARPRSYQLPYSKTLHTRITEAQSRMQFGQTLAGEVEASGSEGQSEGGGLPRFFFMEKPRPPKGSQ